MSALAMPRSRFATRSAEGARACAGRAAIETERRTRGWMPYPRGTRGTKARREGEGRGTRASRRLDVSSAVARNDGGNTY